MLLKMQRLLKHWWRLTDPSSEAPNSIEGAALSEQQISLQMYGLSLLYWTLLYVNAAGHKWLFVQS